MTEAPLQFASIQEMRAYMAQHYPEMLNPQLSKFSPKLTFTERCEAVALLKSGSLDRRIICAAYGINRSTLTHMVNPHSKHYRDVRREYNDLGHDRFIAKYITPAVMERYSRSRVAAEVAYSDDELREAKSLGKLPGQNTNNPKATKMEGEFRASGFWDMVHDTVMKGRVAWVEEPGFDPLSIDEDKQPRPAGWYVLATTNGQEYIFGEATNSKTSAAALTAFLKANELELV